MRYAILSDIHANLEALETAVTYAHGRHIDRWIVLGDTIGYGANPNECFEWALRHTDLCLLGNHEKATVDPSFLNWFNPWAREAAVWTASKISKGFKREVLSLPYIKEEKDVTFAHASLHEPERFHYLFGYEDSLRSFQMMTNPVCFVGHTHVPGCICEGARSSEPVKEGIIPLQDGNRYILNPGSVGQPRDNDPRLAFGIYDTGQKNFEIVRLAYDNIKAADKIRKAGLPKPLADRLL